MDVLPDQLDHGVLVGERAGLELRIEELAVQRELEASAAAGNQFYLSDLLLMGGFDLGRQTDGLGLVVSLGAVFQFNLHGGPSSRKQALSKNT